MHRQADLSRCLWRSCDMDGSSVARFHGSARLRSSGLASRVGSYVVLVVRSTDRTRHLACPVWQEEVIGDPALLDAFGSRSKSPIVAPPSACRATLCLWQRWRTQLSHTWTWRPLGRGPSQASSTPDAHRSAPSSAPLSDASLSDGCCVHHSSARRRCVPQGVGAARHGAHQGRRPT